MSKTHWKRLINPDYIGAYSLEEGQDLTVIIEHIQRDMVTGTGGKKEECTIAYLKGQKPFILNNTNSKSIAKLYGPFIEDWAGKRITLFASTTKLAGDTVECLRIRPTCAQPKKESISDDRLRTAIEQIKTGAYQKDALLKRFVLTTEQTEWLNAETSAPVQA